jgi:uncharacterized protein YoxC
MKKIIHYLRRQPEEVRRSILHLATIIIAITLVALWVYSLGSNLSNPDTQTKMQQSLKPLSVLKDNIPSW